MTPAYGNHHSPDPNGHGIAAERPLVKRLDGNAFVESEIAQAARTGRAQRVPVDLADPRRNPDAQRFKGHRLRHIATDYQ